MNNDHLTFASPEELRDRYIMTRARLATFEADYEDALEGWHEEVKLRQEAERERDAAIAIAVDCFNMISPFHPDLARKKVMDDIAKQVQAHATPAATRRGPGGYHQCVNCDGNILDDRQSCPATNGSTHCYPDPRKVGPR